jgi:flagellar biosynthesis protein FlhF
MEVRTFRAASLQEALEQVRNTLGPDASILKTRSVKKSRLGLFATNEVEVEASPDVTIGSESAAVIQRPKTTKSTRAIDAPPAAGTNDQSNAGKALGPEDSGPFADGTSGASEGKVSPAKHRTEDTADRFHADAAALPSSPIMFELFSEMLDAGVEPLLAKSLLRQAADQCSPEQQDDAWLIKGRLCQMTAGQLHVGSAIDVRHGQQSVVALIGPTGVGKTTTIAKLATSFRLEQNCRVGLITLDTFRAGAVDQLLHHAESLDADLEVVSSADQFQPALHRLRNCDLVLIDTAGRSPGDAIQIRVLRESLLPAQPTATLLAISATSSAGHIRASLNHFASLNPSGLVITKVDEAVGFGAWLSVLTEIDLPVNYLTHGQEVPRDFAVANRRRLASLLLGQGNHHSLTLTSSSPKGAV